MKGLLTFLTLLILGLVVLVVPHLVAANETYGRITAFDTSRAVLFSVALGCVGALIAYKQKIDGPFLLKLFVAAFLVRVLVGTAIFVFEWQEFFGGDALTYDFYGYSQLLAWGGDKYQKSVVFQFIGDSLGSGWGMVYFVAAIYGVIGRNVLAVQLVNSVLGAATAIIIYLCAHHVFNNVRVARVAAVAVAFYPSLVLWSSQGLKDGPTVFCLALCILATLKLGQKFSIKYAAVLACSLFAVLSLRFYVFYMICVATGGAFVIGMQAISAMGFIRQFAVVILLGLSLTYFGVTRYANVQFEQYGSLEKLQRSRADAATSAKSGFGKDVDVSTTSGALSALPIGLLYLLFAPFPWQLASLRQSITLPEMIIWWASFPLLVLGLWFSIRYRLRMISPILIFMVMLSFAYSIFQGNVGTAYRQRAQLLVFYFIFVAVGFVLMLEKREERKRLGQAEKEALAARIPASAVYRR